MTSASDELLKRLRERFERLKRPCASNPVFFPIAECFRLAQVSREHGFQQLASEVAEFTAAFYESIGAQRAKTHLLQSWKGRDEVSRLELDLAPLERRLVEALRSGPKDRFELSRSLYGDRITWSSAELRTKNLIARIRKRHPGLIRWENGRYRFCA